MELKAACRDVLVRDQKTAIYDECSEWVWSSCKNAARLMCTLDLSTISKKEDSGERPL